jgi:hypothetical protein
MTRCARCGGRLSRRCHEVYPYPLSAHPHVMGPISAQPTFRMEGNAHLWCGRESLAVASSSWNGADQRSARFYPLSSWCSRTLDLPPQGCDDSLRSSREWGQLKANPSQFGRRASPPHSPCPFLLAVCAQTFWTVRDEPASPVFSEFHPGRP